MFDVWEQMLRLDRQSATPAASETCSSRTL